MSKLENETLAAQVDADPQRKYPETPKMTISRNDAMQTAFAWEPTCLDHQISREVELKPPKRLSSTIVMPLILLPREAAEYIGKSEKWLEADRRNGPTIPFLKLGRSVRYRAEDLLDIVERHIVSRRV